MKIAGCWSRCVMPSRRAALAPSTSTRSRARRVTASRTRPAAAAPAPPRHRPGDAAFTGSWTSVCPSGSLIGTERTSSPRTSTSASVPASATPLRRCRRASASHGITPVTPPRGEGRRRDDHVRGRDLVEAADDLVAGGLRQPERGDERRHPDDRAEHGQRRPGPDAPSGPRPPRRRGRAALRGRSSLGRRFAAALERDRSFTAPPRSAGRRPSARCARRGPPRPRRG